MEGESDISAEHTIGFLFVLLFDFVDRGDMFLRNVGLTRNYMALQPRDHAFHSHRRERMKSLHSALRICSFLEGTSGLCGQNSCMIVITEVALPGIPISHSAGQSWAALFH
jgi:hypothetical protein